MGTEAGGIRFIKERIPIALVATAMATAVPTVMSAQPNEPAMESTPTVSKAVTGKADSTHDEQLTDVDVSTPSESTAKPAIPTADKVEIQRRFNEF